MTRFSVITLLPCLLMKAAVVLGGDWAWGALLDMTALLSCMDRLTVTSW
ncbi:MAG: hypothetical protein AAF280_14190 [Pseudomonadota bacterium]